MFKNSIVIEIEDLHAGTTTRTGQGNFPNYRAAADYAAKLNDHYCDAAIPRIASVKGA